MTVTTSQMSSFPPSKRTPHVKQETGMLSATSKPGKTVTKKSNLDKIKKYIEQSEDVLVLALDCKGEIQVLASPNLKHDKWTIMQDARETFTQYIHDRRPTPDPAFEPASHPLHQGKQLKKPASTSESDTLAPDGSISYAAQRPAKRQRSGTVNVHSGSLPVAIPPRQPRERRPRRTSMNEAPAAQIEVQDHARLEQWFREAFLTMQQVACRLVAKVWIKKIHPKKQSTHPYNGGMPRDQPPDSNRTKPPYWPKSVIHREPDHIGRDDRVNLLVHLIMNTPQPILLNPVDLKNQQLVTARDLADCLEEKRGELKEAPWEIIQQVVRTREMMEQYEAGEIDGDALVFLNDYSDRSRLAQNESENELGFPEGHGSMTVSSASPEHDVVEDHQLTPTSSNIHSPGDQGRPEERALGSRSRCPVAGDNPRARPNANQQSRSSSKLELNSSLAVARGSQDIPADMTLAMMKYDCHLDGNMHSAMAEEVHPDLNQTHGTAPMMMQQLSSDLPMGSDAFEVEHHRAQMMRSISHAIPSQESLGYQSWLSMMPDLTSGTPQSMYPIQHHIPMQAQSMPHSYYDPSPTEIAGGMHAALSMMDHSVVYQDGTNRQRRTLPVRVMNEAHAGMVSSTDHDMDLLNEAYYRI